MYCLDLWDVIEGEIVDSLYVEVGALVVGLGNVLRGGSRRESVLWEVGVGSSPGCGLCVDGEGIEPVHAVISIRGRRRGGNRCIVLVVEDYLSPCGTYVNGRSVSEKVLAHGDRIRFGRGNQWELVLSESREPSK